MCGARGASSSATLATCSASALRSPATNSRLWIERADLLLCELLLGRARSPDQHLCELFIGLVLRHIAGQHATHLHEQRADFLCGTSLSRVTNHSLNAGDWGPSNSASISPCGSVSAISLSLYECAVAIAAHDGYFALLFELAHQLHDAQLHRFNFGQAHGGLRIDFFYEGLAHALRAVIQAFY